MRVLRFSGTPRAIGAAFGETCRGEIAALYEARVKNAVDQAKAFGGRDSGEADVLRIAERSLPLVRRYHPAGVEELEGIALGADLSLAKIWAMNALTDLRDVLAFGDVEGEGCTAFIVQGDRTRSGRGLLGQSWDLATDNMPYVCVVERKVEGGPSTACLTLVGCLSLIGMNQHGLAIGTTNIRTKDSRPGVGYLDVIHKFLAQSDLDRGAAAVIDAERAGAHYYFAMDAAKRAVAIECTARQAHRIDVERGHYVHTNHVLFDAFAPLEADTPAGSSRCRASRMEALLRDAPGQLTPEDMMRFLSDHEGGELAICRHDFNGISSNGAVIMEPESRTLWAVHGPPCMSAPSKQSAQLAERAKTGGPASPDRDPRAGWIELTVQ